MQHAWTTFAIGHMHPEASYTAMQPKPDMISCKMLKGALTPTKAYGHISGVDIGARFGGRGEIAIVGIHTQMMRGIDSA